MIPVTMRSVVAPDYSRDVELYNHHSSIIYGHWRMKILVAALNPVSVAHAYVQTQRGFRRSASKSVPVGSGKVHRDTVHSVWPAVDVDLTGLYSADPTTYIRFWGPLTPLHASRILKQTSCLVRITIRIFPSITFVSDNH